MSAPRNSGALALGVREALQVADITEELADGLAILASYRINEPVPPEIWRPLSRSAARLATLLEGLAAQQGARAPRSPSLH